MFDRNTVPTLKEIDDAIARYAVHHGHVDPDEHLGLTVHVLEPVAFREDGPPSYRRVLLTDAMAHPGAVESLVRHTTEDLAAELHPATTPETAPRT